MGESACLTVGCFISLNKHLLRLYLCQALCWGVFHWCVWKCTCIYLPQGPDAERIPWACLSPQTSPKQQVNGEKNWISNSTVDRICQEKMVWSISTPLKLCCAHNHLETLLKGRLWLSGSRVAPIFCISNKLLGDADAACLRTTFRAVKAYLIFSLLWYVILLLCGQVEGRSLIQIDMCWWRKWVYRTLFIMRL